MVIFIGKKEGKEGRVERAQEGSERGIIASSRKKMFSSVSHEC